MAKANYGIVDWYTQKLGFNFNDYRGDTRDEALDLSSEDFFDKIMDYAKGQAETPFKAATLNSLQNNTKFKNKSVEIIKNNNQMIIGSSEWFNKQLISNINRSNLIKTMKEDLISNVSNYNSEQDLNSDIDKGVNFINDLKSEFKGATTVEERERATEELRRSAPSVYGGLRSGETRAAAEAFRFVVG